MQDESVGEIHISRKQRAGIEEHSFFSASFDAGLFRYPMLDTAELLT